MIYGASHIFNIPTQEGSEPSQICAIFGSYGWSLTYDFTHTQYQVVIYTDKLDEAGKRGLLFAELAWNRVK